MENEIVQRQRKLESENEDLKRSLALALNKPLIKKLKDALERVEKGEYSTEEEFFKGQKA
ncbi:MAG: hypothetical protein Q7S27_07395 [Nanoarchaeota archaeon]|nr:hypothetical protein [Nanoarchaeota archaeon]